MILYTDNSITDEQHNTLTHDSLVREVLDNYYDVSHLVINDITADELKALNDTELTALAIDLFNMFAMIDRHNEIIDTYGYYNAFAINK